MTSKDKTIRKIEFLKAEMKAEQEQYGRNSLHTKLKLKYLEDVLKDLEILEILKPFVKAVVELKGQNINVLDFHISDSAKTKIKAWLDA